MPITVTRTTPQAVITNLLNSLQWESLQQRQWKQSLVMCYKICHQLFAVEPANYCTAGDFRTRGNHRLGQIRAKKDTYQHSIFPRSIRVWNRVPSSVVDAGSLEDFKVRLMLFDGPSQYSSKCKCKTCQIATVKSRRKYRGQSKRFFKI